MLLILWVGFGELSNAAAADPAATLTMADLRLGAEFAQSLVPISGGQISCYRRPGTGPTLLLIPGTFSDARMYAPLIRELDPSLDLLLLENRGLGGSWPPPEQSSIEQCSADAAFVLDALHVDRFYVGGHSLGGMIAIEMGRQFPDRARHHLDRGLDQRYGSRRRFSKRYEIHTDNAAANSPGRIPPRRIAEVVSRSDRDVRFDLAQVMAVRFCSPLTCQ